MASIKNPRLLFRFISVLRYIVLYNDNYCISTTISPSLNNADLNCSSGWLPYKDSCYLTLTEDGDWSSSRDACYMSHTGADLASILDKYENQFLLQLSFIQSVCEDYYPDNSKIYPGANTTRIAFDVKADENVWIYVRESADRYYYIKIGKDSFSEIHIMGVEENLEKVLVNNLLSPDEWKSFWVTWEGGNVQVGRQGELPFVSSQDTNLVPLKIEYISNNINVARVTEFRFCEIHSNGDRVWMGLNDLEAQNNFVWSDGSEVIYTNWLPGEQSDDLANGDFCSQIYVKDEEAGFWTNTYCQDEYKKAVCKAKNQAAETEKSVLKQLSDLKKEIEMGEIETESDLENLGLELVEIISIDLSLEEPVVDILEIVIDMVDILVGKDKENLWRTQNTNADSNFTGEQLLLSMDDFANNIAAALLESSKLSQNMSYTRDNIEMNIKVYNEAISEAPMTSTINNQAILEIPTSLNSKNSTISTFVMVYKTASSFLSGDLMMQDEANYISAQNFSSEVVKVVINPVPPSPFKDPIIVKIMAIEEDETVSKCGFLDETTSYWSTKGCNTSEDEDGEYICECNHLTSFAVLILPSDSSALSKLDEKILGAITKVGCSLSVIFLCLTFVIYAGLYSLKRNTHEHRLVLVESLTASLAFTQLIFAVGIDAKNTSICMAVAVLLHYLSLSSFFWMFCNTIHIFFKSINFSLPRRTSLYYCLAGWGGPAVIVALTLASKYRQYLHEDYCWLSTDEGVRYTFIVPALLIITANVCALIVIIKSFTSIKAVSDKKNIEKLRIVFRAIVVLVPILGLTWVFGVLAIGGAAKTFIYLFTILNSLQGISIFVCLCIVNNEVREYLRTLFYKTKGRIESSYEEMTSANKTAAWSTNTSKTEFTEFNSKT